ncbi:MAG: AAA family ATPase [Sedimenticola sp.]
MYEAFYGLTTEPFRLSPDSSFCYQHTSYKKAKSYMQYALHRGEGFVMITGRPGTGKTTLINDLTSDFGDESVVCASIVSTQLQADDLLRMVLFNFGLDVDTDHKSVLLQRLETFLTNLQHEGRRPLLIIDETQDLSGSALEELRLLTNLQQNNKPLLQIFLVGQEGLREMVLQPHLEQLHQRIIAACHLQPLNQETTGEYVKHRLSQANWQNDPAIDEEVYPLIFKFSMGIPRWINLICSRMLLHGMVEERHELVVDDIVGVIDGLIQEQLLPRELEANLDVLREQRAPSGNESGEYLVNVSEDPRAYNEFSEASRNSQNQQEATPTPLSAQGSAGIGKSVVTEMGHHRPERSQLPNVDHAHSFEARGSTFADIQRESNQVDEREQARRNSAKKIRVVIPKNNSLSDQQLCEKVSTLLYERLAPLLFGKSTESRYRIFLDFIDGLEIDGTPIPISNGAFDFNNTGPAGFMVWLESANNDLSRNIKDILWGLFEQVDR